MLAINHGTGVPADSRREVLMGYQYALHQHKKKLWEEKSDLRKCQENNSAWSRPYWDEHSGMSDSGEERHREPKHSRRKTAQPRKEDRARSISTPLSKDEWKDMFLAFSFWVFDHNTRNLTLCWALQEFYMYCTRLMVKKCGNGDYCRKAWNHPKERKF
jgi:hypothetical protein